MLFVLADSVHTDLHLPPKMIKPTYKPGLAGTPDMGQ
jgi:hypothetical protein